LIRGREVCLFATVSRLPKSTMTLASVKSILRTWRWQYTSKHWNNTDGD
jgi:hypothetical protein